MDCEIVRLDQQDPPVTDKWATWCNTHRRREVECLRAELQFEATRLIAQITLRVEVEAENAKLRADLNGAEATVAALQMSLDSAKLQIRAAEPVIGAARLMVKHQADRHELSSCCHDVTPTSAYLLARALKEWDETQKRVCLHPKLMGAPKSDTFECPDCLQTVRR